MIKAIIFDFDDTLEDFKTARFKSERAVGRFIYTKYGIPIKRFMKIFDKIDYESAKHSKTPMDFDRHVWFKKCFKILGITTSEKEIEQLVKLYWKFLNKAIKLHKNTFSTLRFLSRHYKIALLSDSDGDKITKMQRIKKLKIYRFFDLIVTTDDTGVNKPNIKNIKFLLKKLNVRPINCLMIGDKPQVDLKPAKRIGMKTAWIIKGVWAEKEQGRKFSYVDYKTKDIKSLINILHRENIA